MNIEMRNPAVNGFGCIDCEILHPRFGWIPFTASPDDPEEYGRDIFAAAAAELGLAVETVNGGANENEA